MSQLPLQQVQESKGQLSQVMPMVNPFAPPGQQRADLNILNNELDETDNVVEEDMNKVNEVKNEIADSAQMQQTALASSYFDIMKIAQFDADPFAQTNPSMQSPEMGMGMDDSMGMDQGNPQSDVPLDSPESLKNWIDQTRDDPNAINTLLGKVPSDSKVNGDTGLEVNVRGIIKDNYQRYLQPDTSESDKMILAAQIFEHMNGQEGEEQVQGTLTSAEAEAIVKKADAFIQSLAKKAASVKTIKQASSFNLKKQAQKVRGGNEFLSFGPESRRLLPGGKSGYLGSDWHIMERNIGHDFNFDAHHFVDFDTFWRANIMDKYHREYRNEKGEYVGGYLNKRFEVNRNVPEGNNYQLLPGQLRRPILPEFGNMESRLSAARKSMAEERGYSPSDTSSKPYNWKEASVKKK